MSIENSVLFTMERNVEALEKLKTYLPHDLFMPLLGVYALGGNEVGAQETPCAPIFVVALLRIVNRFSLVNERHISCFLSYMETKKVLEMKDGHDEEK